MYLPVGTNWYDYYTGVVHKGGDATIPVPLERAAFLVLENSLLPLAVLDNAAALEIHVFPPVTLASGSESRAEYSLYLDDGESLDYSKGSFSSLDLSVKFLFDGEKKLTKTTVSSSTSAVYEKHGFKELVWVLRFPGLPVQDCKRHKTGLIRVQEI